MNSVSTSQKTLHPLQSESSSSSSSSPLCRVFTHIPETNNVPREYSVAVTIHGAYIASSSVESIALLH
jgi:hypothetical protein